jgi:hypothetical protein
LPISACGAKARQPFAEPGAHRRGVGDVPPRRRLAGADLDRVAAEAVDHAEAVLVGEIVADEHRRAPGERRLAHELLDRAPLVAAGGLQLDHHLAVQHLEAGAQLRRRLAQDGLRGARVLRREAKVQRQIVTLVLEQQAFVAGRELAEARRRAAQGGGGRRRAVDRARGVAPLRAVLPGGGEPQRREQRIDVADRAAADQRERPGRRPMQRLEQAKHRLPRPHRVGPLGVLDERAVDVEEERPVGSELRQPPGGGGPGGSASCSCVHGPSPSRPRAARRARAP